MTGNMAYIAKRECGCIVMACVDNPEHRRDTAKEVAQAIREGYVIERVSSDFVRENWFCENHKREHVTKQVLERLSGKQEELWTKKQPRK